MVRVAFTVALAIAILAASAPAIELAGVQRSDTQTRSAVDDLVENARTLAESNDAVAPASGPARRTVTVRFPTDGFASAPIRDFDVGEPPSASGSATDEESEPRPVVANGGSNGDAPAATRLSWRVGGGSRHAVTVDGIRIRPAAADVHRVAGGGTVRYVLRLVARDGREVVILDR